jgi:uncharacterized delta-60 repeat protein
MRAQNKRLLLAAVMASALVTLIPSAVHASGTLDPSFGTGGAAITNLGGDDAVNDVLVQPDGKVVAAGTTTPAGGTGDFALTRYLADGTVDATFGTGGTVTTDASGTGAPDSVNAIVRQTDGKLVAAGITGSGWACQFALARYLADGSLDPSFGTGGIVLTGLLSSTYGGARSVALQTDGKIVAAGAVNTAAGIKFAVARYTTNGTLDPSFGTGGTVTTPVSNEEPSTPGSPHLDFANSIAIQSDGKLVVGGQAGRVIRMPMISKYPAVVRYTTAGALDPTFGTGGKTVVSALPLATANELAIRSDGRIWMAGSTVPAASPTGQDTVVVRVRANGTLDTGFGGTGYVVSNAGGGSFSDVATDLAPQSTGGVLVSGWVSIAGGVRFLLAKYGSGGALVSATGHGVNGPATYDHANAMATQPDGRLVVGGVTYGADADFAVARFLP